MLASSDANTRWSASPAPDPPINVHDPCRHLVLQPPNWLGDVVMAQPAMRAFITAWKPERVSIWGRPWLADALPFLDLPGARFESQMPRGADAAVMFPNSFRAAWVAASSGARRRIGFRGQWRRALLTDAPAPRVSLRHGHHREYFLDLAEQMGIEPSEREVRLAAPEDARAAAEALLRERGLAPENTIALAPGAQFGGAKRWPAEAWSCVAEALSTRGWHLVVLGTPAERETGEAVMARATGPAWNAAGETSLKQALGLLAACRALLCNDSGLMHAAAGMGQPVVAIFGATDPARTAPSGPRARVLYRPAACSPCLKRECRTPGHPCMGNILPEDVERACLAALADNEAA